MLFTTTVFHLRLSLNAAGGLWVTLSLKSIQTFQDWHFFVCDKWYTYSIITYKTRDFPILQFQIYTPIIFLLANLRSWIQSGFCEKKWTPGFQLYAKDIRGF